MSQIAESGTLGQTSPETPQDGGGGRDDSIPRRQEALSPCGHRPGRRGHNAGDEDELPVIIDYPDFGIKQAAISVNLYLMFRVQESDAVVICCIGDVRPKISLL